MQSAPSGSGPLTEVRVRVRIQIDVPIGLRPSVCASGGGDSNLVLRAEGGPGAVCIQQPGL